MKKAICLILLMLVIISALAGCGSSRASDDSRLSIVTTIFPEYDWVMNILGDTADHAEVTMLLDTGVDLHSYQPTADDIVRISTCDIFIFIGGESDAWVEGALKSATNKDMKVINLMSVLGDFVKEEETVEGMEVEEESEEEPEEEETEYDEHVWLSLRNAALCVEAIKNALTETDTDRAEIYETNAEEYISEINALDAKYSETVNTASRRTVLFGDRFPFRYLADDYGLEYYAAFSGCSAESEASFETIAFLADKVNELQLPAVLVLEGSEHKIAETIIQTAKAAGVNVLPMNSMQATTSKDVENGASYMHIMESNLDVLAGALR